MPGDYSRFTDDPRKRFSRLLMQQGRVQLDSDWNELVEIFTRRDRIEVLDIIGPAAVPAATTPNGFKITVAAGDLAIGAGRMYVDGLLAEAFADDKDLLYSKQPFWPDPTPLASLTGAGLVYLDVWDREITAIEDPALLEPALAGIDTTTRTQTVWQVRILIGTGLTCSSDLDKLLPPSAARLSVQVQPPTEIDPCLPPESGGVEDVENRFYRVEVHEVSPVKFKFYRDPVVSRIEAINATKLIVERIGLDSVLRFLPGQWVEVTNDRRYLDGQAGLMAKIVKIDEAKREIELDRAIAASETSVKFPARLIRWDQQDGVDANGLLTATGAFQPLERGIEVKIAGGSAKVGDYWNFPSRVAGRTAGPLTDAPPRPEHHYAALATVTGLGGTAISITNDCRNLWPQPTGGDCECTVCVTAEEHNGGSMTIQKAIDLAKSRGGGKVCLRPGVYVLRETIRIQDATALSLTGHGIALILFAGSGPVILVENSGDIVIEELGIARGAGDTDQEPAAVLIRNCLLDVTIRHCAIVVLANRQQPEQAKGAAVVLDGIVSGTRLRDNFFFAPHGLTNDLSAGATTGDTLAPTLSKLDVVIGLEVRNNAFFCSHGAVVLLVAGISAIIEENAILTNFDAALLIGGFTLPGGAVIIDTNVISAQRFGIFVTTSATQVTNNTIIGSATPKPGDTSNAGLFNIAILMGGSGVPMRGSSIIGNRISNFLGNAIFVVGDVEDLLIKQNVLRQIGGGGIVFNPQATATRVSIENNDLVDVAVRPRAAGNVVLQAAGIGLPILADAQVSHNSISGLGPAADGIAASRPLRLRLIGNAIDTGIASPTGAGIAVLSFGAVVEIADNSINGGNTAAAGGGWSALRVGTLGPRVFPLSDAPDVGAVVITGNTCRGFGQSSQPVVSVVSPDNVTFADNFCMSFNNQTPDSIVSVQGRTAIVSSNRVAGPARIALQVRATVTQRWTVLGNIADQGISVDGAALTAPWLQLNRT